MSPARRRRRPLVVTLPDAFQLGTNVDGFRRRLEQQIADIRRGIRKGDDLVLMDGARVTPYAPPPRIRLVDVDRSRLRTHRPPSLTRLGVRIGLLNTAARARAERAIITGNRAELDRELWRPLR